MKRFLVQILIFGLLSLGLAIFIFYQADGNSDAHYAHFTTPKQSSLILGTSKAAQAIQPRILDSVLGRDDFYNYSFTVVHSPYGPSYFESVKNKLDPETKDGIFVLTVDPYSVSSRLDEPEDIENFRENKTAVAHIKEVNTSPNYTYLLEYYPYQYIYILTKKLDYVDNDFVHEDGWEEINITMKTKALQERIAAKIEDYEYKLTLYNFSETRYNYFEKTIEFLKNHGKVFLVRLPVSEPFLRMENAVYSEFDERIQSTCSKYDVEYLDLTKVESNYEYTDGNHLYKTSGAIVTRRIALWMKSQL